MHNNLKKKKNMSQEQAQSAQDILPAVVQNFAAQADQQQNQMNKQNQKIGEEQNKGWWTLRKKIFVICFFVAFVVIGLGVGLGLTIGKEQRQQSVIDVYDIEFENNVILRVSGSVTEGQHSSTIQVSHNKTEVVSQDIQLVLSRITVNESEYLAIVPIFQLLALSQYYLRKEYTPSISYFDEYNKNPSSFSQKLKLVLSQQMPRYITNKNKTLQLIGIQQKMMVQLQYNPEQKIFNVAQFPDDLNASSQLPQENQNLNQNQISIFQANTEQSNHFCNRTALLLLDIISRNLNLLENNTLTNSTQSKKAQSTDLTQDWQRLLITKCRSVNILRYRCTYSAVEVLVPGFKRENEQGTLPENSFLTYALSVQFREVGLLLSSS